MQVEIFSDVVCPWCALGKRRFERALADFPHRDEVEVVWRSFELDPSAPDHSDPDVADHLARKYGVPRAQILKSQAQLTDLGAAEGLVYRFELTRRTNTFDAHRLLHHAYEVGDQNALKSRLLEAYFSEGADVGDHDTLVRLAADVGLDPETAAEILRSGAYGPEVRADEEAARAFGISGVPFFVVNRRIGISGAQAVGVFRNALDEAWARAHPARTGS